MTTMASDFLQPTKFDELQIWGNVDVDSNGFGDVPTDLKISVAVGIAKKIWAKHVLPDWEWLISENDFVCVAVKIALETPFDDSFKIGQKIKYLAQRLRMRLRNFIRDEIRQYKRVRLVEPKPNDAADFFENIPEKQFEPIPEFEKFQPFVDRAFGELSPKHQSILTDLTNGVPVFGVMDKYSISRTGINWIRKNFYSCVLKNYAIQSPEILNRFLTRLSDYPNADLIEDFLLGRRKYSTITTLIGRRKNVQHETGHFVFTTLKTIMEQINDE